MSAILLLGGRSEIGLAIVEALLATAPGSDVVLAQRPRPDVAADEETPEVVTARLRTAGAGEVEVVDFDAMDLASHEALLQGVFARHHVDHAIVAFGILGNQEQAWTDVAAAQRLMTVNATAATGCGVALAAGMIRQGSGHIIAISSVAGVRVRRSNFVYGASKAAMDGFFQNLSVALRGTGVEVLVVRPGAVATRMIAGNPRVALTTTPQQVADATLRALGAGKDTVSVPAVFAPVMALSRALPWPLWRRLTGTARDLA